MNRSRDTVFSIHTIATVTMVVLAVGTMAIYLPMLYAKLFVHQPGKTHLLFSPVIEKFIYREKIVGEIPPESFEKAVDHRPEYAYRDEDGRWYTRVDFEKRLPFIYYKNMELWGLLPIKISGRTFDKDIIKNNRQIWELKQGEACGARLSEPLYPLLESTPGQARLSFPPDRFRMTPDRMEFVNIYKNQVDDVLSTAFTAALKKEGFIFPARSVNGKFSILKPYDAGIFLVDDKYTVFHILRKNGEPVVVKTPVDPALKTSHIKVSEKKNRAYYGLLVSETGTLHLLSCDTYKVIELPLKDYDINTMDFKLIRDPLYTTAIYSDNTTVYGVAMNHAFEPLTSYNHRMSRAEKTVAGNIYAALFPFSIKLEKTSCQGSLHISFSTGGIFSIFGIFLSILYLFSWKYLKYKSFPKKPGLFLVILTGIYGVIVLMFIEQSYELDHP